MTPNLVTPFLVAVAVTLVVAATAGAVHLVQSRRQSRRLVAEINAERLAGEREAAARRALGIAAPGDVDALIDGIQRDAASPPPWEAS